MNFVVVDEAADGFFVNGRVKNADWELNPYESTITIDLEKLKSKGWSIRQIGALIRNLLGQAVLIPSHDLPGVMSREDMTWDFTQADRDSCAKTEWCAR